MSNPEEQEVATNSDIRKEFSVESENKDESIINVSWGDIDEPKSISYPDDFKSDTSKVTSNHWAPFEMTSSSAEIEYQPIMHAFLRANKEIETSSTYLRSSGTKKISPMSSSLQKQINFDKSAGKCLILDKSDTKNNESPLLKSPSEYNPRYQPHFPHSD